MILDTSLAVFVCALDLAGMCRMLSLCVVMALLGMVRGSSTDILWAVCGYSMGRCSAQRDGVVSVEARGEPHRPHRLTPICSDLNIH